VKQFSEMRNLSFQPLPSFAFVPHHSTSESDSILVSCLLHIYLARGISKWPIASPDDY
jgi:hypothetical protein